MDESTRRAIVAEVMAAMQFRKKQPWQFDIHDAMAESPDVCRSCVHEHLMREVRDGHLHSEMVVHEGKQMRVWWRTKDEPGQAESQPGRNVPLGAGDANTEL